MRDVATDDDGNVTVGVAGTMIKIETLETEMTALKARGRWRHKWKTNHRLLRDQCVNTDIGGVNIDEGMLPSAVNNSIRELMTHQKEAFGSGTPLCRSDK